MNKTKEQLQAELKEINNAIEVLDRGFDPEGTSKSARARRLEFGEAWDLAGRIGKEMRP